jgi:NNP family nitrate/nitrite transporter-like MFS transporter
MTDNAKAITVLTMNTIAFGVCFACWMMNGVLITFLVDNRVLHLDKAQIGWLIGIPVLTGALMRLPLGVLTDTFGGRVVFTVLLVVSAIPMYLTSYCSTYGQFALASLGFGLSGASFAVGIAYTSVWFKKERQGTALGIFGMGNTGAALTSIAAPTVLGSLTRHGEYLDGWRTLPKIYAAALLVTALLFYVLTHTRKVRQGQEKSLLDRLSPLKYVRVWRFGLYYFFVFGGFVALAQWLIPYYVNAYSMSIATAGMMATLFSLPSGLTRALGGWLSDRFGARSVMYRAFGTALLCCVLLSVPRMDIRSPGEGVMALKAGTVTAVSTTEIAVGDTKYPLRVQADVWIFSALLFSFAIVMGIGMAGVYKFIPDYFPNEVGVVGGIVGVLGGLGGFFFPILFGYLLRYTGIWTTCWLFLFLLALICLLWMHAVVRRMMREKAPQLVRQIELQR